MSKTAFIEKQWSTLCESARVNSRQLASPCSERARDMMDSEVTKFCETSTPESKEDLHLAYTQRTSLSARLTAIARADAMAREHPDAAEWILAEVATFCEAEFPASDDGFCERQRQNLELSRRIAEICEADLRDRGSA